LNWAGLIVSASLLFLAVYTAPYGLVLLVGLWWVWSKS
jgi:hypothetical protein